MKKHKHVETGVVAELNGEYWGILYEDGHITSYGFGGIFTAKVSDPDFCTRHTDLTYKYSPYIEMLKKAKLKKITITTIYEVED